MDKSNNKKINPSKIPKEYLGAFKAGHRYTSRPFIEDEFAYKLLDKVLKENCEESRLTLEWLTRFNNEFHKNVVKKDSPDSLNGEQVVPGQYKTNRWGEYKLDKNGNKIPVTYRSTCHAMGNSRNADIFSREYRSLWSLTPLEHDPDTTEDITNCEQTYFKYSETKRRDIKYQPHENPHEDTLIELIDLSIESGKVKSKQ